MFATARRMTTALTAPDVARRPGSATSRVRSALAAPVDIASLVAFRVAFGLIMAWEMWRYISKGWVEGQYADPEVTFPYWPFTFVEPLPRPWLDLVFWGTGAAGLLLAAGLAHRLAATSLFAGVTYIFLLDKTRYLNHFYLVCLIAFLVVWLDPHRAQSVDARRRPALRSATVPAWQLWLLRFQIAVPYFFGGIAKLNGDWLRGRPLRSWLEARTDFPGIGRWFDDDVVTWAMNYGALLLDLLIVPALLHRRTRPYALAAAMVFHLFNARLFSIGIFPWLMMAATLIFLPPSWPRQVLATASRAQLGDPRMVGLAIGAFAGFALGGFLPLSFSYWRAGIALATGAVIGHEIGARRTPTPPTPAPLPFERAPLRRRTTALLALWVAVQVLVPLRHLATPGVVHWTEEGHNFSWHMKLRDKDASVELTVTADGRPVDPDAVVALTSRQRSKMSTRPHMLVQYAHMLEDRLVQQGHRTVEVRALVWASLNGRPFQLLVDPTFDLTTQRYPWFDHAEWILPLDDPVFDPGDIE